MTRLTLEFSGGPTVHLEVRRDAGGGFAVLLEDGMVEGSARITADGEGLLRMEHRSIPFYFARAGDELHLWMRGELYRCRLATEESRRAPHLFPGSGELAAPMPGLVLKVLAAPGDRVDPETPVVVMESMKMELTLAAPATGTVREVLCEPGRMVDAGAVLLRLEPEE